MSGEEPKLYEVPVDSSFVKHMIFNFRLVVCHDKAEVKVEPADTEEKKTHPRWPTGAVPSKVELREDVNDWLSEHCAGEVYVVEQRNDGGITLGFASLAEATHFKLRFVGTPEPG